jgi:hypothetical protein
VLFILAEEMYELSSPIVHADEDSFPKDRPSNGVTLDVEICFDVAHELEWILTGTIAHVDEREDWNPPHLADVEQLPRSFFHASPVVEKLHSRISSD